MTDPARQVAMVAVMLAVAACGPADPDPTPAALPSPTRAAPAAQSAPPADPPDTLEEPPVAGLSPANAEAVPGDLGTYTIGEKGADSPWLPGEPVTVPAGSRMTVKLAQGIPIAAWRGRITVGSDSEGLNTRAYGSGVGEVVLPAPPAGAWTLAVTMEFAGFDGEATYYWRVSVEEP